MLPKLPTLPSLCAIVYNLPNGLFEMTLQDFVARVNQVPSTITFAETKAMIAQHFDFTPTAFSNGEQYNEAGENNGSCQIFALGILLTLTKQQTLACFGEHYAQVLATPEGQDHLNIRNFIQHGWEGINYKGQALTPK